MNNEELVKLYQDGNKKYLDDIIFNNKGLVYKVVNLFNIERFRSIDKEDLIQEGFIGLIKAVDKYNPNNEYKASFSTYALQYIKGYILIAIRRKKKELEVSSLNAPIDDDTEILDLRECKEDLIKNKIDEIYYADLRVSLEKEMIKTNTLREREVIKLRNGWDIDNIPSCEEVGEIFGVSRSRIQQIENYAYRKLRNNQVVRELGKDIIVERAYI